MIFRGDSCSTRRSIVGFTDVYIYIYSSNAPHTNREMERGLYSTSVKLKMSNLPCSTVILSPLHQVIDVSHPNLLNVVPLDVFEADLGRHQGLLSQEQNRTGQNMNSPLQ